MQGPTRADLIARLQRLEAEQRRWRRGLRSAVLLGAALVTTAMAWPRQDPEVLRARRLEAGEITLVHGGRTRMRLAADDEGTTSLTLLDAGGRRRAVIAAPAAEDSRLSLFAADGSRQHPFLDDVRDQAGALQGQAEEMLRRQAVEIESKLRAEWPERVHEIERWIESVKKRIGAEPAPSGPGKGK